MCARSTDEAGVKEDYYDCYVVMKVPTNATINLCEIGIPHLSFFGCSLQCCSYELSGTSLHDQMIDVNFRAQQLAVSYLLTCHDHTLFG
jgi:hypothetical protein